MKSLTAHFSASYLIANCRRIAALEFRTQPNWVIAMNLFAVGSTTAHRICREAGIDPDGTDQCAGSTESGAVEIDPRAARGIRVL